jgi:mannose-6-phosphate isomerase-like protein (cupin superfamily)
MQLVTETEATAAIDLTTTPLHLSLGSRALPIDGFAWDPDALEAYAKATADDGPEGRLVMVFESRDPWTVWERHPAGDEVVVCLSGRLTIIREIDGRPDPVELGPNQAMINPKGVWHTADVHEPGWFLTITAGQGTEHRPR